jgi:hypothetical protein
VLQLLTYIYLDSCQKFGFATANPYIKINFTPMPSKKQAQLPSELGTATMDIIISGMAVKALMMAKKAAARK